MSARERILKSAKELFSQKGYNHTTVDDIVKHAGLSKGAFYFYFKSKDQLMEELVNTMAEKTKSIMKGWLEKGVSAEESIRGHIRDFLVECYEDRHIAYVFFFELICNREDFRRLYLAHLQEIRELLTELVERGYRRGEFLCGSTKTLVNLIAGYVRLIYMEELLLNSASLEDILKEVNEGLDLIFRGLKCG
ncbi:TetR/AcrR family transcriptional regulator [Pampinifervens florentissimum]|uniref:TetR/AcrR family transcriptional regulator n=1 Tax=Pampinifervens florentissimum TaxID=1632019 RepID=UPI0013B4849B|nr:TetR/AcrR family transcriptional regulator [Hydrogenobacter sp. T-8]QID32770.1 TetR/AcrR family transcriptional regulator [Hydrogenobacter sp. T-8]